MSVFNPDTQASAGPEFTGASRGIPPNRGFEALFSGIGNAVEGGVKTANNKVLNNIQSDVYGAVDATNDAFGIDSATDVARVKTGTGNPRPPALDERMSQLELLGQAFQSGKLNESHYWGRLTAAVKDLRAKYPGYREDIDRIVSQSTGVDPANALRNTLFNDWQSETNALNASATRDEAWIRQNMDTIHPALLAGYRNGTVSFDQMMAESSKTQYQRASIKATADQVGLNASLGTLNADDAFAGASQGADQIFNDMFTDATSPLGIDNATFSKNLKTFTQDNTLDANEQTQLLAGIRNLKQAYQMKLQEFLSVPRNKQGDTYRSLMKGKDKEVIEQAMQKFSIIEDAVVNKDYGVLSMNSNWIAASGTAGAKQLIEQNDMFGVLKSLNSLGAGDQFNAALLNQPDLWSPMVKTIQGVGLGKTMSGDANEPLKDKATQLNKAGAPPDAITKQITDHLDIITNFANGQNNVPVQSAEAAAEVIYGGKNKDFLEVFNERSKGGSNVRLQLFNQLYSPQVTTAMQKLAAQNPDMWKMYRGSAIDKWQGLFSPTKDNLKQQMENTKVPVVYNTETGQFEMQVGAQEQPAMTPQTEQERRGAFEQAVMARNISEVNSYLRSLNSILDAGGEDKGAVTQQLFEQMGIKVETGDLPTDQEDPNASPDKQSGLNPDDILLASFTPQEVSSNEPTDTPIGAIRQLQSGTRRLPISPQLEQTLSYAAQETGLQVDVFSGGQPSKGPNRTGSHRHDNGRAADLKLRKNGRYLDMNNDEDRALMQKFLIASIKHGATGIGAGVDYMGSQSLHVGGGTPGYWGAHGHRANAPAWVKEAYDLASR